ncbi:MAG: hypothetical protein AAB640_02150 [Patescibacteria group bacterium]
MANKKDGMTIEDLAAMMERNLASKEDLVELQESVEKKISNFKTEIKNEIRELQLDARDIKTDMRNVKIELEQVHDGVDQMKDIDLPKLKSRVTILEKARKVA